MQPLRLSFNPVKNDSSTKEKRCAWWRKHLLMILTSNVSEHTVPSPPTWMFVTSSYTLPFLENKYKECCLDYLTMPLSFSEDGSVPFTIGSGFFSEGFSPESPVRPSSALTLWDFTSRIVSVYPTSCRYLTMDTRQGQETGGRSAGALKFSAHSCSDFCYIYNRR